MFFTSIVHSSDNVAAWIMPILRFAYEPAREQCLSQNNSFTEILENNAGSLTVASVAAAAPYLVQKSGVALPSQATMMLLPAAIVSSKLLTKGQFPLIDTTTIVFDRNADKEHANIADHIVATSIIHADTICATSAAVTGVAACNQNNSWQATAGFAAASGLFTFGWYKVSQFKRDFSDSFDDSKLQIEQEWKNLPMPEPKKDNDCDFNIVNYLYSQKNSKNLDKNSSDAEIMQRVNFIKTNIVNNSDLSHKNREKILGACENLQKYTTARITYNKKALQISPQARNKAYVDESISVARQFLPWNKFD